MIQKNPLRSCGEDFFVKKVEEPENMCYNEKGYNKDSKIEVCEHNLICEHSFTVSVHKFYTLVNTKSNFVFTVFGIIPSPYNNEKGDKMSEWKPEYNHNRKRKMHFHMELTSEEWCELDISADEANMSKSAYMRKLLMEKKVVVKKVEDFPNLLREINAIGRNINQITKKINSLYDDYYEDELKTIEKRMTEVNEIMLQILESYNN